MRKKTPNRKLTPKVLAFVTCTFLGLAASTSGGYSPELSPATPFTDHMVLQAEMAVPVWGVAPAGSKVTVSFRNQKKEAISGNDGVWKVLLDAMAPGGPDEMRIEGTKLIILKDILVGEVWVCSGQSNMAYDSTHFLKYDPQLERMNSEAHPQVRIRTTEMAEWKESTPESNSAFSAQGFAFAVTLNRELKKPVGIIVRTRPGMPASRFLSQEMFMEDKDCSKDFQAFLNNWTEDYAQQLYTKELADWEIGAAQKKKLGQPEPPKPAFPVKPDLKGARFGEEIKGLTPYFGYAIRGVLWDQGEGLSGVSGVPQDHIIRALINGWRKKWGINVPFISIQKPSGGGCAYDSRDPIVARSNPFGQLPPCPPKTAEGLEREAHVKIMTVSNTVISITSDLVPGTHPPLKSSYAERNVRVAQGFVYGQPVEYLGPMYQSHTIENGKVCIVFGHVGKGLVMRNAEKLQGFCLAGDDRVFHWADSCIIKDNSVIVSSAMVPRPVAVRYAWGAAIAWANLFNQDGLPALTFRTDVWPE